MTFRLLPPAAQEIKQAAKFYEGRVSGLGFDFIGEVRASIRLILSHPQAWCPLGAEFHRCRTRRFPYGVIYTIEADHILIVSVMHLHRHPESWRKNLGA
ncbi:MAG: type II toxin-antitoxin system RelE/ParE family toxin [Verrucomicrobia bacterium]|nr:type II toxin-antitoxin system RelE/ParE family toxin [Verrucomicrobiota bacterium]